jgi:lantibiotic modifying enzyme
LKNGSRLRAQAAAPVVVEVVVMAIQFTQRHAFVDPAAPHFRLSEVRSIANAGLDHGAVSGGFPGKRISTMPNEMQTKPIHGLADQSCVTWQPLLAGSENVRAMAVVNSVANRLRELVETDCGGAEPTGTNASGREVSLAGGAAGIAILFAYLSRVRNNQDDERLARTLLDRVIAAAAAAPGEAALYSGLAGTGWAIAHLRGRLLPGDGEEVSDEIDDALAEHVAQTPWKDDYDLISGLVGFGVYALERVMVSADASQPAAVKCLECVVERMAETAERRPEGITWQTNPDWLPDETREKFPEGYYNTGLAHGVPGVIAMLACACAVGVAEELARPLLDGAVRWLLAQQLPGGFPAWVTPDTPGEPTRLAWCYGDPGVAASLFWAARCVHEPAWESAALAIARRAAECAAEKSGVVDAGLCHGAAGLGHIFNRVYQSTGEAKFADAARFWFERTLQMRQPERGIAGYAAWTPSLPGQKDGWIDDPGILTGAAGIALALLAATTNVEPEWDRMLLVSVPPTR